MSAQSDRNEGTGSSKHGSTEASRAGDALPRDRASVIAREKDAYGGIKIGSAFFGWLTATGAAALLLAVAAAAGIGVGLGVDITDPGAVAEEAGANVESVGLTGGIILLVILFIAYFSGGYVAGRMARFDGTKQGLAVWLWAVVIAVVLGLAALLAGDQFNLFGQFEDLGLPTELENVTTAVIVAVLAIAVVTLLGALLGGKVGMNFHRRVDRAGLGNRL